MAIYHLEVKTVSRQQAGPAGSAVSCSAVAAAAYRSGRCLHDERRGVDEDYSRRGGVVRGIGGVELPEHAPEAYRDPGVLWNAVEAAESATNARLYREFVVALPVELYSEYYGDLHRDAVIPVASEAERIERAYADMADVARSFARSLADQGMCSHWELHDPDREQRNPHVHIMCTTRSIGEDGEWLAKTRKHYLMRDTEGKLRDRYASPEERRRLEERGWAPVYAYDTGARKPVRLTAAQAAERGLGNAERVDRHPVCRSEKTNDWDDDRCVAVWRQRWEETVNAKLAERGHERDAISARSYEERGINRVPTVHEGSHARALEEDAAYIAKMEGREYVPVTDAGARNLMAKEVNERIEAIERDPIPNIEVAADPLWIKPSWQQRAVVEQLMEQGRRAMEDPIHPDGAAGRAPEADQRERAEAIERNRAALDEIQQRADLARELSRGALERAREHAEAMERQAERERALEAERAERIERAEERAALIARVEAGGYAAAERQASRAAAALGRLRAEAALGETPVDREALGRLGEEERRLEAAGAEYGRRLGEYERLSARLEHAPLSEEGAREAEDIARMLEGCRDRVEEAYGRYAEAAARCGALQRMQACASGDRAGYERICAEQLERCESELGQLRALEPDARQEGAAVAEGYQRLQRTLDVRSYAQELEALKAAEEHLGRCRGEWNTGDYYRRPQEQDWDEVDRLREEASAKVQRADEAYDRYISVKSALDERPATREDLCRLEVALGEALRLREIAMSRDAEATEAWWQCDRAEYRNAAWAEAEWEYRPRDASAVEREALDRAVMSCDRAGADVEHAWRSMDAQAREQARALRDLDAKPIEPVSRDEDYWERARALILEDRCYEVVELCRIGRPLEPAEREQLDRAVSALGDSELDRVRNTIGYDNARLEQAVERTEEEYRRGVPAIDPDSVPRKLAGILASAAGGGDSGYERPAQRRRRPDRDDDEGWHHDRGPRMGR